MQDARNIYEDDRVDSILLSAALTWPLDEGRLIVMLDDYYSLSLMQRVYGETILISDDSGREPMRCWIIARLLQYNTS